MPLPIDFIERLKDQNRIEDVMRGYVTLKHAGHNLKCLCPFHSEKTPSCVVYTEDNSFHCFGCQTGGDVITFIMKIENLSYIEAVRFLAQRVGLSMPEDGYDDRAAQEKKRLIQMNKDAANYFYKNLLVPEGREGLNYLVGTRRLKPETVKSFGLGIALNHWTGLKNHMLALGYTENELIKGSLLSEKNGRTFDFFVNRVIFPIIDLRGNVIAFSGRTLEKNPAGGKYLNSRETALYKKSRTLFALNFAKNTSVKSKRLILCEGNVDVISLHQAGFTEAVATCGTAITGEHARLMSQYCDEVYICYDSDAAGQKATKAAISILSAAGLSSKVVKISGDGVKDVDDYIKKYGPDHFKVLLENSAGSTEYELSTAKSGIDDTTDGGKVEYLKKAAEVLAGLDSRIEREVYISRVAAEQGISKDALTQEVNALLRKKSRQEDKKQWHDITQVSKRDDINPQARYMPKQAKAEENIIAYIFLNQDKAGEIFEKLPPDEMATDFGKKVYKAMENLYKSGQPVDLGLLGAEFSVDEMGRISSILTKAKSVSINSEAVLDCIEVIKQGADKPAPEDMSEEDFEKYMQKLRKSKK